MLSRVMLLCALLSPVGPSVFAAAQVCPAADAAEPDDVCSSVPLSAAPAMPGPRSVVDANRDWTRWQIAPGWTLVVDVFFSHAVDDVDAALWWDCGTFAAFGASSTDDEHLELVNTTGAPRTVGLEVFLFDGQGCNDYSLAVTLTPPPSCFGGADAFEPNDACSLSAPVLPDGTTTNLAISPGNDDYFLINLVPGDEYLIDAFFLQANGNIDLELWSRDCDVLLDDSRSNSDDEQVVVRNVSDQVVPVKLRVFSSGALCTNYSLGVVHNPIGDPCNSLTDDGFEPNAACFAGATLLPQGTYPGMRVLAPDADWYRTVVPAGFALGVQVIFSHAQGDLQLSAWTLNCADAGIRSLTTNDLERISVPNVSTMPVETRYKVWLDPASASSCNDYILVVTLVPYIPLRPFCFGDGSGTLCPCGNDDPTHPQVGGCANATGRGARLYAGGVASIATDTLRFDLEFGLPGSFAVLLSADNALGAGLGVVAFDGLRCVGGNAQRQGTRAISASGTNNNPWGSGGNPPGGLIAQGGFAAGQRTYFQAFYRSNPAETCNSGQNMTNAIRVDVVP